MRHAYHFHIESSLYQIDVSLLEAQFRHDEHEKREDVIECIDTHCERSQRVFAAREANVY